MDGCVQVVKRFEGVPSLSLLSSTEAPEVFDCLRAHVTKELKHDPTSWIFRERVRVVGASSLNCNGRAY